MNDPLDLQAREQEQEAREASRTAKRQQEVEDIKWLMAHPAGRRLAVRVLERTGNRRTSFHTNGSTMAFNEGRRDVGLWFEGELLEVTPDAFLKMLKEFRDE